MWKVRILPGRMSILNPCWWEFLGGALTSFDGTLWEPRIEQLLGGSWRFSLSMFCEMLKDDQFSMILIWLRLMMFGIIHSLTSLTHDLNDLITYEVTTLNMILVWFPNLNHHCHPYRLSSHCILMISTNEHQVIIRKFHYISSLVIIPISFIYVYNM